MGSSVHRPTTILTITHTKGSTSTMVSNHNPSRPPHWPPGALTASAREVHSPTQTASGESLRRPKDPPGPLSNYQVHDRLKKTLGKASNYLCSCLGEASEWAYQHSAIEELSEDGTNPYSEFSSDYLPMCRRCHRSLDSDSYRENGRRNGKVAGAKLAACIQVDPEYRDQVTRNLGSHLDKMKNDPEYQDQYRTLMTKTNLRTFRCDDCGYENNAGNMGKHFKATGHSTRTEVI